MYNNLFADVYPVKDEIIIHPDDLFIFGFAFGHYFSGYNVPVKTNRFMQRGVIVAMGKKGREIIERMKFDLDIQNAMKENAAFLKFMQNNGLA